MNRDYVNAARASLPLPRLLDTLLTRGLWKHPGDEILRQVAPFIHDPLVFPDSIDLMLFNSGPLSFDGRPECEASHEYLGSKIDERDLPWIDVEKTIYIAYNKWPGDDVGIALDFRPGLDCPRVVGGDWHSGNGLQHRLISSSFHDFVATIGISTDTENGG